MEKTINPITIEIIKKTKDMDNIRGIAKKTGFAYSAVYNWINKLSKLGIFVLEKKGNKTQIKIINNEIYIAFKQLIEKVIEHKKDLSFWNFIAKTHLKLRLGKETSAVILTKGGYITNDFYNQIYHVEISKKDYPFLCKELIRNKINFSKKIGNIISKPFIIIKENNKFKVQKTNGLPLTPLIEVVKWCKKLKLEPILEQLSLIHNLPLKDKYSEVFTND